MLTACTVPLTSICKRMSDPRRPASLHLIRFHAVLAPNAKLRREIIPSPLEPATEPSCDHAQGAPARMSWARLLKRVFDIDIEHCPNCGGRLEDHRRHRRSAGDPQNPQPLGPADPRPAAYASASSQSIPDNLTAENCLPTQAAGAARSEFERAAP
jgi:hypothetical protein